MIRALACLLALPAIAVADSTLKQPPPIPKARPIIAIDDRRTHGPTARNWLDLALEASHVKTPDEMDAGGVGRPGTAQAFAVQLAVMVPQLTDKHLKELFSRYQVYALRVRATAFTHDDDFAMGPMTFALQRFFPFEPIAIAPLVHAHTGLEVAVSTPWLSDRFLVPPRPVQELYGVDSELQRNGWSLRPVSAYLRADFLACRSLFAELAAAPEAFVPSSGRTDYNARFHAALGFSLVCGESDNQTAPTFAAQYRGRVRAYSADDDPDYFDSLGATTQLDAGWVVIQLYFTTVPRWSRMDDEYTFGARIQLGREK